MTCAKTEIFSARNIPHKEELELNVIGEFDSSFSPVILKMGTISEIKEVTEKDPTAASFLVGTTEFTIPLGNNIDIEAELAKLEEELIYQQGFLNSVMKKLGNEKFVANAKPEIVENERKKQADAESKIKTLQESIANLKK